MLCKTNAGWLETFCKVKLIPEKFGLIKTKMKMKTMNEINGVALSSKQMKDLKGGRAVACGTNCGGTTTSTCWKSTNNGCLCTVAGVSATCS